MVEPKINFFKDFTQHYYPTEDKETEDLNQHLDKIFSVLDDALGCDKKVLVHW